MAVATASLSSQLIHTHSLLGTVMDLIRIGRSVYVGAEHLLKGTCSSHREYWIHPIYVRLLIGEIEVLEMVLLELFAALQEADT
jgi:hypothetical protein